MWSTRKCNIASFIPRFCFVIILGPSISLGIVSADARWEILVLKVNETICNYKIGKWMSWIHTSNSSVETWSLWEKISSYNQIHPHPPDIPLNLCNSFSSQKLSIFTNDKYNRSIRIFISWAKSDKFLKYDLKVVTVI